jgi:hypothetical protein
LSPPGYNDLVRRASLLICALALGACAPGVRLVPCNADADCEADEFCELGQCAVGDRPAPLPPPDDGGPPPPPPPPPLDGGPDPVIDAGPEVPGDWLDPRWGARAFVELAYSDPEVLTDFPVAVRIDDTFAGFADIDPTGADLRVSDVNGAPLPFELDAWTEAGGVLWTRVPRVDPAQTSGVWLYFDNPSASPFASPAAVFDDDTVGVYHLTDARDSAAPIFEGDVRGDPQAAPDAGALGGAIDFDGTGDAIDLGGDLPHFQNTVGGTLCALVNARAANNDGVVNFSNSLNEGTTRFGLELGVNANEFSCLYRAEDPVGSTRFGSTADIPFGEWAHICVTLDLPNDALTFILDGEIDSVHATPADQPDTFPDTPTLRASIGAEDDSGGNFAEAMFDEVFISRVPRSPAYLRAHYRNLTGALVTVGDVETIDAEVRPNQPPGATDDTADGLEDNPLFVDVLANDTDPDGNPLRVVDVTAGNDGDAHVAADGTIFFRPDRNESPTEVLTYTVSDGFGGTATGEVTITVAPVNDRPNIANRSFTIDAADQTTLTVNVTDVDDNTFTLTVDAQATLGNAQIVNGDSVRYTAPVNQGGDDSFRLRVRDPAGATDTAVYTVTVNPPPPPVDGGVGG